MCVLLITWFVVTTLHSYLLILSSLYDFRFRVAAVSVMRRGHDTCYIRLERLWYLYDGMRARRLQQVDRFSVDGAQHIYLVSVRSNQEQY